MKIGSFNIDNNIFLAPMAGVTDKPFRVICKHHGCGLVYSEMISAKGLYYGSKNTKTLLDIDDAEAPAAVQLFGSEPDIMGDMAEVVSRNPKVAIIDINMGCPAPKITKNCEGSALMKNMPLASKIIKAAALKSVKPVTVKFRKGWDKSSINAVEFAKMAEDSGASAIAVHGRTRTQMYSGIADLDIIKQVKEKVKIPVIGNGDVRMPEDAKKMFELTGCDAVMIGRGALGNPWIFERTAHFLETGEMLPEPTIKEKIDTIVMHLNMMYEYKGQKGVLEMRKHIAWYIKGLKGAAAVRETVNKTEEMDKLIDLLYDYEKKLSN